MDVRDLEVFLSVAKHLNFTRAGEEVHLSQPSVSVRVRRLEEDLGVKLFEQLGKKVALTEAGRLLEPHARRVVAALDDARHVIEEVQGLERGVLRIGASTTPGIYLVPKLIARFKRIHPKIEVRLEIKDTRRVEEGLIRNEYDFGFVGGHLVGDEVKILPWRTDEVVLVVAPSHPLAQRKLVLLKDVVNQQFIFRERGSATRVAINEKLRSLNLQLEAVMEMDNPEAVKQAVQAGLGIAFLSRFAVGSELKAGTLVVVKVRGLTVHRELKIASRKDKHLSRAAQAFIEVARQASEE
jgi:DNA-binding transcriptional LysR family regulator